jgi:cytochrome P450
MASPVIAKLKTAFARLEAEGMQVLHEADADVMQFLDGLKRQLAQHPEPLFAVLRRVKPILIVKGFALVTRFADVEEVLSRDRIFQVTYGEKMKVIGEGQNFFLGMQNSPEYERDEIHMRTVIRRTDIPGIVAPFVAKTAESVVAGSGGRLDVVSHLAKVVPTRLIAAYFGCPPGLGSPAVSEAEPADWASTMFQYLFADLNNDPKLDGTVRGLAPKMRAWLDAVIAQRKARPTSADDVLGRCLALQNAGLPAMDDASIRNNLIGLIVGAIPTTSKCCAQALDELLKRPAELEKAQQASRAGDDALLSQYVFEALRFNPHNPGLFRIAGEDYTVAKGSLHATLIPQGTTVFAATQSAMFDDCVVDSPDEFQVGRPAHIYMHFGFGLHTCFGQYINGVQIPGILKPLLQRKNLRRAAGEAGQLQYDGPFPSGLNVEFD